MAPPSPAPLDSGDRRHIVSGMLQRLITSAMTAVIREQVTPMLVDITERMDRLESRMERLEGRMDRLEAKLDATTQRLGGRIDQLEAKLTSTAQRLDARIDESTRRADARLGELTAQQSRMVEQIANLRISLEVATTVSHRIDRLEDRVFPKAS